MATATSTRKLRIKLTDPQFAFLEKLAAGPTTAVERYAPAQKAVALGFASSAEGRYGTLTFTITEAGQAHYDAVRMQPKMCHSCKTAPWTCRVCKRQTCEHYCKGKNGADKTAICGRSSCSK